MRQTIANHLSKINDVPLQCNNERDYHLPAMFRRNPTKKQTFYGPISSGPRGPLYRKSI